MAVVEYVVADAAEQGSANRAAAARAHHDEIVLTALDLVDQGSPDLNAVLLAGMSEPQAGN